MVQGMTAANPVIVCLCVRVNMARTRSNMRLARGPNANVASAVNMVLNLFAAKTMRFIEGRLPRGALQNMTGPSSSMSDFSTEMTADVEVGRQGVLSVDVVWKGDLGRIEVLLTPRFKRKLFFSAEDSPAGVLADEGRQMVADLRKAIGLPSR